VAGDKRKIVVSLGCATVGDAVVILLPDVYLCLYPTGLGLVLASFGQKVKN